MKRLIILLMLFAVTVTAWAQTPKAPQPRSRTNQLVSDVSLKVIKQLAIPSGPAPYFPAETPDSMKCGSLFNKTTTGQPNALMVYDCFSASWTTASSDTGYFNRKYFSGSGTKTDPFTLNVDSLPKYTTLSGYGITDAVPYSGATGDVSLGSNDFSARFGTFGDPGNYEGIWQIGAVSNGNGISFYDNLGNNTFNISAGYGSTSAQNIVNGNNWTFHPNMLFAGGVQIWSIPATYNADLSAQYTARTLIDKGYADAHYLTSGSSLAWSSITGKPTTLSGYGITDAGTLSQQNTNTSNIATNTTNIASNYTAIGRKADRLLTNYVLGTNAVITTSDSTNSAFGKVQAQINTNATNIAGKQAAGNYVTSISLTTPGVLYTTPVNWTVASGAASATLSLATQTANTVLAGPGTGSAATPTFRALVTADIPTLNQNTTGSAGSLVNALTQGTGIATFSYNGASAQTVAINQAFAPTWTGSHIFQNNAVGTTITPWIYIANNTPAISSTTQLLSPALSFRANIWNTTNQPSDFIIYNEANNFGSYFTLAYAFNGGTPSRVFNIDQFGGLTLFGTNSAGSIKLIKSGMTTSSADGLILTSTASAATSGAPVRYSPGLLYQAPVWNTSGTPASNIVEFREELRPVSSTSPTGILNWLSRVSVSGTGSFINSMTLSSTGLLSPNHISSITAAPTIAAGSGAGTSPTVSISGNDMAQKIAITTGASPTASATVATITFNVAYASAPRIILTPVNSAAAALNGTAQVYVDDSTIGTTSYVISVGSVGLAASTTYLFYAHAIQ
jgi:hypothetical protein